MRRTLDLSDVLAIKIDDYAPGHGTASGYGTHRTRYRLQLSDKVWRRVKVDVYGNGGAGGYVRRGGADVYLSTDLEYGLPLLSSGALTADHAGTLAWFYQSPGTIGRHLTMLASGLEVAREDLLDDVRATRAELAPAEWSDVYSDLWKLELYALTLP